MPLASLEHPGAASPYLAHRLAAAGLPQAILDSVRRGETLRGDAVRALRAFSLPVLSALVSLRPDHSTSLRIRKAHCLPLALHLGTHGRNEARRRGEESLLELERLAAPGEEVFLIVDSWSGGFASAALLEVLSALTETAARNLRVELVGPSTGELKKMLGEAAGDELARLRLIRALRAVGASAVEGGSDLDVHRAAVVEQLEFVATLKVPPAAAPLTDAAFDPVFTLLDGIAGDAVLREQCRGLSMLTQRVLEKGGFPGAVQVLSLIAIARLALPQVPFVRAPAALFGRMMGRLAASLAGANDLGYAALSGETARMLGIPRAAELAGVCDA